MIQIYGWRDLKLATIGAAAGAGTPSLANFGATGGGAIKQMSFGIGDSIYLSGHIEHDYLIGSTVFPHVHWSTNGTNVNTVKWQITCIIAKSHDQDNFGNDVIITVEEAAAGTAWRHMLTEDTVGFDALEPDALWLIELKRISNGGTDNTDVVFGLYADFHYQTMQYSSPNRTPNFYT